jgi:hypothetical protein
VRGKSAFSNENPGSIQNAGDRRKLAVEEIELIEFGYPPDAEGWIDVDNARVAPNPPADFTFSAEPLVDELHQWKSRDWPGKVTRSPKSRKPCKSSCVRVKFGSTLQPAIPLVSGPSCVGVPRMRTQPVMALAAPFALLNETKPQKPSN